MPLSDRDPNLLNSGRASRASNLSNGSRSGIAKPDTLAAGVHTMLRTTTELGDLGSPMLNQSRLPRAVHNLPRFSHRSSATSSRVSISSSHTQGGFPKRNSNHHAWPSGSSVPRQSFTTNANFTSMGPERLSIMPTPYSTSSPIPPAHMLQGGRSLSLTHAEQPPYALSHPRSYGSLRGPEPIPRPRSPYHYPTRLRRPGYRSPSPAFSDVTGMPPPRLPMMHRAMAPRPHTALGQGRPHPFESGRHQYMHSPIEYGYAVAHHRMGDDRELRPITPHRHSRTDILAESDIPPMPGAYPAGFRMPTPSTDQSSSSPAPPTPQDGVNGPQFVIVSNNVSASAMESGDNAMAGIQTESGPLYYDYSEQFVEKQVIPLTPPMPSVPTGFVQRIKTILEERAGSEASSPCAIVAPILPLHPVELPAVVPAELPGSNRITREMILSVIEPSSEDFKNDSSILDQYYTAPTPALFPENSVTIEKIEQVVEHTTDQQQTHISQPRIEEGQPNSRRTSLDGALRGSSAAVSIKSMPSRPDFDAAVEFAAAITAEASDVVVNVKVNGSKTSIEIKESPPAEKRMLPHGQRPQSENLLSSAQQSVPKPVRSLSETNTFSPIHAESVILQLIKKPAKAEKEEEKIIDSLNPSPRPDTMISHSPFAVTITEPTKTEGDLQDSYEPPTASSPPSPVISTDADITLISAVSPLTENATFLAPVGKTPKVGAAHPDWALASPAKRRSYKPDINFIKPKSISPGESSTTNLKLSTGAENAVRLADVKEEPNEERPIQEPHHLSFRFPVPPQTPVSKKSSERVRIPLRRSSWNSVGFLPTPSRTRALSDTRIIPSLHFSRSDLFEKFTKDLDVDSSERQSLLSDPVGRDEPHDIHSPIPQRPASSLTFRERYKSFFAELDELEKEKSKQEPTAALFPTVRPLSPVELINEVNRLSIPSVHGLTQRLSELLPSLKRFYSDTDINVDGEQSFENAVKEIRELGSPVSRAKKNPHERSKSLTTDLSFDDGKTSVFPSPAPRSKRSKDDYPLLIAELEAPLPTIVRSRSASDSILELSADQTRSHLSSPTFRPWNIDASYPWTGNSLNIDITLPQPVVHHDSITNGSSQLRLRRSNITENSSALSFTREAQDFVRPVGKEVSTLHKRSHSRGHSLLGSLSKRILPGGSLDAHAFPQGPDILGLSDRAVDPGDRYPTTGLSPPSAFNLEEVRSFFSDDSSQSERQPQSFRKRLTQLKCRLPLPRAQSALDTRCARSAEATLTCSAAEQVSGSAYGDTMNLTSSLGNYDGIGMSKAEFAAKKLLGKLKSWWFIAGDALGRTFSRKGRSRVESASFRESSGFTLESAP